MKHHYQGVLLKVTLLLAVAFTLTITSQAQCTLITYDANGDVTSLEISCDFPAEVLSDEIIDKNAYESGKESWASRNPAEYELIANNEGTMFIKIPASVFSTFPSDKQAIMLANKRYLIEQ